MRITQSRSASRALALALLAAVALPMAGCARNRAGKGDLPYVARDVGTLYTAAKTRLDQKAIYPNDFRKYKNEQC